MQEGNGAEFLESPKLIRPDTNRISEDFITQSCHHFVSVRLGIKQTTKATRWLSSAAFFIRLEISLPYRGFIQHLNWLHSLFNPSTDLSK
ncbi:MAG: hypothetical protein DAHOPDDO_01586 [Ignavibacteriaceae bacterium]|nr:hypothetical protein [Ignavibacteriaceae bacterium]